MTLAFHPNSQAMTDAQASDGLPGPRTDDLCGDASSGAAPWVQDTSDYSWTLVDDDDCFYRAASSVDGDGVRRWVIAWSETVPRFRVRIGPYSYETAEEAKASIERIAVFAESEAA